MGNESDGSIDALLINPVRRDLVSGPFAGLKLRSKSVAVRGLGIRAGADLLTR